MDAEALQVSAGVEAPAFVERRRPMSWWLPSASVSPGVRAPAFVERPLVCAGVRDRVGGGSPSPFPPFQIKSIW